MHGAVFPTFRRSLPLQLSPSGNVPELHPEVCLLDDYKSSQVDIKDKPWLW